MKTVAQTLGVSRSRLSKPSGPQRRRGRPPVESADLLAAIKAILAERPSWGYRRVWALLRRRAAETGGTAPNHKRIYRVMKVHGLLLEPHSGQGADRRHDGRIAVDRRNARWCSDGFEIGCDDGQRVRVAFALDCCDREAMGHVATTGGVTGEMIRDLMLESVERRFGPARKPPEIIEWLSDNGSCYTAADTRSFAKALNLKPITTPIESPQSNGMAEAFVRTIKRDYARFADRSDARTVMAQLPRWFEDYNAVHPHRALGCRSPRQFIAQNKDTPLSAR